MSTSTPRHMPHVATVNKSEPSLSLSYFTQLENDHMAVPGRLPLMSRIVGAGCNGAYSPDTCRQVHRNNTKKVHDSGVVVNS
jgi:hypothetical protein